MEGSKMSKTEYNLKAIMYSAYDTPHKLRNISGNKTIRLPRLPPNNAGRPMRQFKCPLALFKWRAGFMEYCSMCVHEDIFVVQEKQARAISLGWFGWIQWFYFEELYTHASLC